MAVRKTFITNASSETGSIPASVGYMMVRARFGFNDRHQAMTSSKAEANPRPLSEAAKRALAEAEARREQYRKREAALPKEVGGRGGLEPGRYGDWEVKGIASDF
jgi:hypothetical protein